MTQRTPNLIPIGWLSGKDQKANLLAFADFAVVNNSLNVKNTFRNLVTEIQAIVCQPLAYDQNWHATPTPHWDPLLFSLSHLHAGSLDAYCYVLSLPRTRYKPNTVCRGSEITQACVSPHLIQLWVSKRLEWSSAWLEPPTLQSKPWGCSLPLLGGRT